MHVLSNRIGKIKASPIRKLAPLATQAEAEGTKVYYLNIGQPDIPMPIEAKPSLGTIEEDFIKYGSSTGQLAYRKKLSAHYNSAYGCSLVPEQMMITTGASEGIYFALMTILDHGENILVPEPFYANYMGFADMAGIEIKALPTVLDNGFALPPDYAFEEKCGADTRAILLSNPNNPTGAYYPKSELLRMARLAERLGLWLIVDEVYRDFYYGSDKYFSSLQLDDFADRVIVIDSISKKYNACGARIGALICKNKNFIEGVTKIGQFRLCPPRLGQELGMAVLDAPKDYLINARIEYQKRRDYLYQRLTAIDGVQSYVPEGAFYIFARLPIDSAERFCAWLLSDFTYEDQTLMLSPGSGFYFSKELGEQEVRIAYVLNVKDLEAAMNCLERALVEYRPLVMQPGLVEQ